MERKMFTLEVTLNSEHPKVPFDVEWSRKAEQCLRTAGMSFGWENDGVTAYKDFDGQIAPSLVPIFAKQVLGATQMVPEALHAISLIARCSVVERDQTRSSSLQVSDRCNLYCCPMDGYMWLAVFPFEFVGGLDAFLARFQSAAETFTLLCMLQKRIAQGSELLAKHNNPKAAISKMDDSRKLVLNTFPLISRLWDGTMPSAATGNDLPKTGMRRKQRNRKATA